MSQPLILGSSSPYRAELLKKFQYPFTCISPDIDETPFEDETPLAHVERLSVEKAKKVAKSNQNALIIGSDLVAVCDDDIMGKPHTHENAIQQLQKVSGKAVVFYTGLCLYNAKKDTYQSTVDRCTVYFKELNLSEIEAYLKISQPYKSACGLQIEGLGITLVHKIECKDPNTLIGLPLIDLVQMLKEEDVNVLVDAPRASA